MTLESSHVSQNASSLLPFTAGAIATGSVPAMAGPGSGVTLESFGSRGRNEAAPKDRADVGDPYELAFLRAGGKEVLTLHLFDLVQRGHLAVVETRRWLSTMTRLARAPNPPAAPDLTELERALIGWFDSPLAAAGIFSRTWPEALKAACSGYRRRLEEIGLLRSKWPARAIPIVTGLLVFGLAVFLVGLPFALPIGLFMAVTAGWALSSFTRLTADGNRRMRELEAEFEYTRSRAKTARVDIVDPDLLWGVAAFGAVVLAASPYDAFAAAVAHKADNGSSDVGGWWGGSDASCGGSSGCGSGCGGGGCGGGCGGG
jgi:uncharacterized protein (TIGR04222 family)